MTTTDHYFSQHTSLSIPEDYMEMATSPYHHVDDLDLDVDVGNEPSMNDDYMYEDDNIYYDPMQSEALEHYKDDEMADEDQILDVTVEEEPELLDWQDDDLAEHTDRGGQEGPASMNNFTEDPDPNAAIVPDDFSTEEDQNYHGNQEYDHDASTSNLDHNGLNTTTTRTEILEAQNTAPAAYIANDGPDTAPQQQVFDDSYTTTKVIDFANPSAAQSNHEYAHDLASTYKVKPATKVLDQDDDPLQSARTDAKVEELKNHDHLLSEEIEETSDNKVDTIETPTTEVRLHPVQLVWGSERYTLFPPDDAEASDHFLLNDTIYANENFDKLLNECRKVLGAEVPTYHDLAIDFPNLGLHICEDSKYATQLSLSQVIDAYMLLSQNEQKSNIGPLVCTLSTRPCISKQVQWLQEQADAGRPYSEVVDEILADQFNESDGEDTPEIADDAGDQFEAYDEQEEFVENENADRKELSETLFEVATASESAVDIERNPSTQDGDNNVADEAEDLFSNYDEEQEVAHVDVPASFARLDMQTAVEGFVAAEGTASPTEDNPTPVDSDEPHTPSGYIVARSSPEEHITASASDDDPQAMFGANGDSTLDHQEADEDDLLDLDLGDRSQLNNGTADAGKSPSATTGINSAKRKLESDEEDFEIDVSTTPVKRNRSS